MVMVSDVSAGSGNQLLLLLLFLILKIRFCFLFFPEPFAGKERSRYLRRLGWQSNKLNSFPTFSRVGREGNIQSNICFLLLLIQTGNKSNSLIMAKEESWDRERRKRKREERGET